VQPQSLALRTEQPSARTHESLSGLIERVTFFNDENGWAVLKVKAKGHRDLVSVVGSLASVSAGEWFFARGGFAWDSHFSHAGHPILLSAHGGRPGRGSIPAWIFRSK
jgi:hypothetical protein